MKIVLLDSFAADQGEAGAWSELTQAGSVTALPRTAAGMTVAVLADADAVITNKAPLTAAMIAALPQLRYIGICATGTNIVDLEAARARGIAVTNVPGYSTDSVAQLAFGLILQLTLDVGGHARDVRAGRWAASPDFCFFEKPLVELSGKTLVVIGMGAIGRATARIGAAFGMKVVAAAVPGSTARDRMPLFDALAQADVVTLHCPLTPQTQSLVGPAFLAALQPGALLINTSRGGLIDEAALIAALESGRLGGVGLDVLSTEPPPAEHPLTRANAPWADRIVITPHIAWGTVEARVRLRKEVAANMAAFVRGESRNRVA